MPYLQRTIQFDSYLSEELSFFSPWQSHNLTILNPIHLQHSDNALHLLELKLPHSYGRLGQYLLQDPEWIFYGILRH